MNRITPEHIEAILSGSKFQVGKLGEKTTVLTTILPSGFELVVTSSCVDPGNYDQDIGVENCKQKVVDKLYELEGYRLQDDLYRQAMVREAMKNPELENSGE
jgi:hypothetical protein